MKQALASITGVAALLATATVSASDVPGSSDHPDMGRYQGSEIVKYKVEDYGQTVFATGPVRTAADAQSTAKTVEGSVTRILYLVPKGVSPLEVFRNFESRVRDKNYELKFAGAADQIHDYTFKYKHPVEVLGESGLGNGIHYLYAEKSVSGTAHHVSILVAPHAGGKGTYVALIAAQSTPMSMQMVDAEQMQLGLDESGKVSLYGIYFDHDSAAIKPESATTLTEILTLMTSRPDLKIIVVGHTDNAGGYDYNLTLSKRRAKAVKAALIEQYGIDASRLRSDGVGYLAPAATNRTDAGRTLNRRVELVEDR